MASRHFLTTVDQFSYAISLVPRQRNPPLYKSATARTRRPVIQGHEFWPERSTHLDQIVDTLVYRQFFARGWLPLLFITSPINEPLVCEFYANLETIKDHVTARADVCGISFYLALALIVETFGFLSNDYRFLNMVILYDLSPMSHTNTLTQSHSTLMHFIATKVPIDGVYIIFTSIDSVASGHHSVVLPFGSVITRICVRQCVLIYTYDIVREFFGPFTRHTLIQSEHHVGQLATNATNEDMKAGDAVVGGGAVLDEDYLVDQIPLQYSRNSFPPCLFHPDLGAFSSTAPQPITRKDLEEHFQRMRINFFIPVL
ncbi:hypothetical protein F0562_017680 [Nyssa sinensis]|uniref:Uncharacterized protein n=1 Tax=Nyssa sinensis TaxID=561372 RepID=A0A5J4ZJF0_9ASTE|nr:hypothetical protein F0562_017680 [Nyssa sinensis]